MPRLVQRLRWHLASVAHHTTLPAPGNSPLGHITLPEQARRDPIRPRPRARQPPHIIRRMPLELERVVAPLLAQLLELGLEHAVGIDVAQAAVEGSGLDACV